jgi:aspartyl-tRNA synthetase
MRDEPVVAVPRGRLDLGLGSRPIFARRGIATRAARTGTKKAPMSMLRRTHTCGQLTADHAGQTVTLNGWVNAYRGHGQGLVFVDLRDRDGITQVVFEQGGTPDTVIEAGGRLRNEDCVAVTGTVRLREKPNPKIPTGTVEVVVTTLEVLCKTSKLPFLPSDESNLPNEETRLEYRYLDLRRPRMQEILRTRHRVTKVTRDYFDANGFLEVETPMLCRSTPEGARDFLVPSRLQAGLWYALPQSPQLFKQILMVAGCDRYLQIVKCFRDEDPRFDRQAEFTQIDLEMAFVDRETVMEVMEGFARTLWKEVLGVDLPTFERMTYREAMDSYGIDRPDTRYDLRLHDICALAAKTEFGVFTGALEKPRGVVKAIRVPAAADKLTRKVLDGYAAFAQQFGAGGVPFTKMVNGAFEGGVAKFLGPIADELIGTLGLENGDVVIFGADTYAVCTKALGELRQKIARDLGVIPEGAWNFLWVYDFPMFEHDAETGRYYSLHHPFTAPTSSETERFLSADPGDVALVESIVSDGYDMICNGSEIGGGSIRIHRQDVQRKVFSLLGLSDEEAKQKFSFLLDALTYGAPPHGGIAFGLDRLVMHMTGTENIREVIAFPKTMTGQDLMCQAPNLVDDQQLKELHVKSTAAMTAGV